MQTANLHNLLVPVDYSQTSLNALDLAIAMSQRHNAEIRLLYVLTPFQDDSVWSDRSLPTDSTEALVEKETVKLQKLAETVFADHAVLYSVECRVHAGAGNGFGSLFRSAESGRTPGRSDRDHG